MAQCQTCEGGKRVKQRHDGVIFPLHSAKAVTGSFIEIVCPSCGGTGIESCCDGEDRWQPDKMDRYAPPD